MQGSFTVLVAEPYASAGVDVCAPTQLRRKPGVPLLKSLEPFRAQFADEEVGLRQPVHLLHWLESIFLYHLHCVVLFQTLHHRMCVQP